ncbi:lipase [Leptospira perolatii]|uniref:Lipase n=1 Tax=Leptospira perolatii TaxID=2023191 RepID=A0A2M9ZLJ2_9LEPT|nr:alpha/beta fold hydrolase [Leptospira perolatii]PJZ69833.1 lipase [Leptospira perolatii]PJZ72952.1 lipase [Leptospira perolatii]
MRMLKMFILASVVTTFPLLASGGGTSSKPLSGMYPVILSHGTFGWGSETDGPIGSLSYWGGMDEYLRSQGAVVYAPTKTPAESNEYRGKELSDKITVFMAANGYSKVHILGHSQGGLDARFAIANLGLSNKVVSLTTLNSPHRGTPVADVIKAVIPDWLKPSVAIVLNTLLKYLYGDEMQVLGALKSLTTEGMATFNSYTPNSASVKYYSYGSHIIIPDLIQHPFMGLIYPICAAGGLFNGQGASNDGLVPVTSHPWGTWKGGPSYGLLTTGLDHFQVSDTFNTGDMWFDVKGYYLQLANNMKDAQEN